MLHAGEQSEPDHLGPQAKVKDSGIPRKIHFKYLKYFKCSKQAKLPTAQLGHLRRALWPIWLGPTRPTSSAFLRMSRGVPVASSNTKPSEGAPSADPCAGAVDSPGGSGSAAPYSIGCQAL